MARKKRLDVDEVLDRERAGCGLQEEQNIYQTAGYIRLSIEDSGKTNGYSLENQEKLVRDYIADRQDLRLYRLYIDNGATGTVFERPAFDEMMQDMKDGKIDCIVVKDLSRLGRNYLEAGNYLEQIFPFFRVRFISITDGYDSNSPDVTDESLIIPLKNIINEGYAKDLSLIHIFSLPVLLYGQIERGCLGNDRSILAKLGIPSIHIAVITAWADLRTAMPGIPCSHAKSPLSVKGWNASLPFQIFQEISVCRYG